MRVRGFTIIELLVVIGILALLMGLTIGGIAAMGKTDKLLATEHLVSGLVRQARHTARTSGSPVILQITKAERRISGVTRVSLAQEGFEGAVNTRLDPARSLTIPPPFGITGDGAVVESLPTGGDTAPELRLELPDKLIRKTNRNEGFYLSCSVKPPPVALGGSQHYPILLVGDGDQIASAIGGIYLRTLELDQQNVNQLASSTGQASNSKQANLVTWEIVGMVYNSTKPETPYKVSSLEPGDCPAGIVRDEPQLHASTQDFDVAWPMTGGVWEEVGLLFDGDRRLVLYRNGVRVGEKILPSPTILPRYTPIERVVVGRQRYLDGVPAVQVTGFATDATFDDVAIFRLAAVDGGSLPGDVEPTVDARITAHPDGRIELMPAGPLSFSGRFGSAAKAEIEITSDGKVTSKIIP